MVKFCRSQLTGTSKGLKVLPLAQNANLDHRAKYNDPQSVQYASEVDTTNADASNLLSLSSHQPSVGLETPLATIDDWSFLSNLGGSTDDLYSMDADFRDVLENGLDPRGF